MYSHFLVSFEITYMEFIVEYNSVIISLNVWEIKSVYLN